nr:uracil-DNA glycosylase [Anaerolineae bacterium]
MSTSDSLEKIAHEVATCTRCPLHSTRTNPVPGEGPSNAQIMFIGEGPGFHEDRQGRPFVGASGDFLTEMLNDIGLQREEVFIANVVKCRPPGNRDPEPAEIKACREYLDRQIALINPRAIVTLGRFSMARWFPDARISQIHGKAHTFDGRVVVPFFHPAAALHQPSLRQTVMDDFRKLLTLIQTAAENQPADSDDEPEDLQQLSLF